MKHRQGLQLKQALTLGWELYSAVHTRVELLVSVRLRSYVFVAHLGSKNAIAIRGTNIPSEGPAVLLGGCGIFVQRRFARRSNMSRQPTHNNDHPPPPINHHTFSPVCIKPPTGEAPSCCCLPTEDGRNESLDLPDRVRSCEGGVKEHVRLHIYHSSPDSHETYTAPPAPHRTEPNRSAPYCANPHRLAHKWGP